MVVIRELPNTTIHPILYSARPSPEGLPGCEDLVAKARVGAQA